MRKRALELRLVRRNKRNELEGTTELHFEQKANIISHTFNRAVKTVAVAAVGYILVDTLRQVAIEWAATPTVVETHTLT